MNKTIKYILISVLILVIAMFIFSYIFNPLVRSQVHTKISEIKGKVSDTSASNIDDKELKLKTENSSSTYDRFNDITYSIAYEENETDDFIVINFKDNSGYLNDKCYRIIQRTNQNDKTLCEECNNKS